MAATVTLNTTTLAVSVDASALEISIASTANIQVGYRLWIDRELMAVTGFGITAGTYPLLKVRRGVDGSVASAHTAGSTITIGRADQFYAVDPVGAPPAQIPVSPYINVVNGNVWFSQGDQQPAGVTRYWQLQTVTYGVGALGVATTTLNPTVST